MEFDEQLSAAMRSAARTIDPPVPSLVAGGVNRGRQLRRRQVLGRAATTGGAAVLAGGLAFAFLPALGPDEETARPGVAATCAVALETGPLPEWARAGFSRPEEGGLPYVLGDEGDIVAIVFAETLSAPPREDRANKVLWVARETAGSEPLVIDAHREGTDETVRREVDGGPGPSTLDLPAAGCWRLTLSWGTHTDTLNLLYSAPTAQP